jgi:hypothetical protein
MNPVGGKLGFGNPRWWQVLPIAGLPVPWSFLLDISKLPLALGSRGPLQQFERNNCRGEQTFLAPPRYSFLRRGPKT